MAITQIKETAAKALMTGFSTGTMTVSGVEIGIRQSEAVDHTGNITYVPDEEGNDSYALVYNKGKRLAIEAVIYEDVAEPAKGDLVTINAVNYIVEAANLRRSVEAARLSMTVYKPDGVTWAAPGA